MEPKVQRTPVRLTRAAVEALQPEASAYFLPVVNAKGQGIQGLNLRVLPSGLKVFVHRYRFQGFQRTVTLGRFPAMGPEMAEKASRATQARIDAGQDPLEAKVQAKVAAKAARRAAFTVADLAERYLAEHVRHDYRRQGVEAARLIRKHILPALGGLPLAEVGPADISALLHAMRGTPVQANRTRGVMRTMFGRAEEWELRALGSNPVTVVKLRAPEVKRQRRLSDLEVKRLGQALAQAREAPELILAVKLALMAGMRKGEIEVARWSWFDAEAGELRIPATFHKTGSKTGKPRVVHLCSSLVVELMALPRTLGCPTIVPGRRHELPDGTIRWGTFTALQNPWERIREAAGLAVKGQPCDADPGWHDLRRTFASVAADLGLKGYAGELLGHAEATVTDIYTRAAVERLHEAAEAIGGRLAGILAGTIDPEAEALERRAAKGVKTHGAS